MTSIEIRHGGEVISSGLTAPLGKIKFLVPYPAEWVGEYFMDENDAGLVRQLQSEITDLEVELGTAVDNVTGLTLAVLEALKQPGIPKGVHNALVVALRQYT